MLTSLNSAILSYAFSADRMRNVLAALAVTIFFGVLGFGLYVAAGAGSSGDLKKPDSARSYRDARRPVMQETTNRLRELLADEGLSIERAEILSARSQNVLIDLTDQRSPDSLAPSLTAEITGRTATTAAIRTPRALELSPTQLLAVAVGANDKVLWWDVQPDPFLIRTETADDSGRLSGAISRREALKMLLPLPNDTDIKEIRLYRPQWNGESFKLAKMAAIPF